jgi:hypothetical protein
LYICGEEALIPCLRKRLRFQPCTSISMAPLWIVSTSMSLHGMRLWKNWACPSVWRIHRAHRPRIQAHTAGCQAPSPRHRPGTSCSVDRTTRTGSQILHSLSLSKRPGSDRSPGRRRFGPRNCILACRQLRTSGRRWGAEVTVATPAREGVQASSCVIFSHELQHQRRQRS